MSAHTLKYGEMARQYDTTDFQDSSVKRIIKKLSDIERAALPSAQLEEVWRKHFYKYLFKQLIRNSFTVWVKSQRDSLRCSF